MNKNYRIYTPITIGLILLTIIIALAAILTKNEKWQGFYTGLTDGLITTLLSLFFITIIIEENRKRIEEENRRAQEREVLKNNRKNIELIHSVFDNQYSSWYSHLQEVFKENFNDEIESIDPDFSFVRLKKIFDQNMIVRYGFSSTNIQVFYRQLNKYVSGLRLIVLTTDFGNQYDLKKEIVNYLNFMDSYDIEYNMLEINNLINNKKESIDWRKLYYEHVKDDNNIHNPPQNLVISLTGVLHTIIRNTILAKNKIDEHIKKINI